MGEAEKLYVSLNRPSEYPSACGAEEYRNQLSSEGIMKSAIKILLLGRSLGSTPIQ
jgi:hypothetical protein